VEAADGREKSVAWLRADGVALVVHASTDTD
jgi:hypothetical protein